MDKTNVNVIGAGLAGSECAYALANAGIHVTLYDMKPAKHSPAHKSDMFGELVCSNSLKAERTNSASGMLKREMSTLGSLILEAAEHSKVAAGGALAVDRDLFAEYITKKLRNHENIDIKEKEIESLSELEGITVVATGPLTADKLSSDIAEICGGNLSFYDAAAPIVEADSLDFDKVFYAARYDRGEADYINCPFTKEEYDKFIEELTNAESVELKEFEKDSFRVYEGCMPIEVLAKRGPDTLRFGPLRPVGLDDPRTGRWAYAIVQLRAENKEKTLYNIVGFQTNLKFGEQKRVFSMIPGLENANFTRYGVMHRNTFIDSPRLLSRDNSLVANKNIFFAGQITGVEGYVESSASGILVARQVMRRLSEKDILEFPKDTMYGALHNYIFDESIKDFQPMGANMGLLPPLENKIKSKQDRYEAVSNRGYESFLNYLKDMGEN